MRTRTSIPVALLLAVSACSDEPTGLPGDRGEAGASLPSRAPAATPATADQACDQMIRLCERFDACAPFLLKLIWGDVRTCGDRVRLSCLGDAAAPGTSQSAAQILTCTAALATTSCADLLNNNIPGCVARGALADGAPCGASAQCAGGRCARTGGCGTCSTRAASGGACKENDDCDVALVCSKAKQCQPPGDMGAACSDNRPCRSPLYCQGGVCARPGGAGEPCTTEDSCDLVHGFFCNTQAKVCQTLRAAGNGEPCGLLGNPVSVCGASGECRPNAVTGVCQSAAREGEACGPGAANRKCLPPASCADGVCAVPAAASCR